MSAVRERLVENEITDVTLFCDIMNAGFNLVQNLNISSLNDSSPSLDTFSLLIILFCKISFLTSFNS